MRIRWVLSILSLSILFSTEPSFAKSKTPKLKKKRSQPTATVAPNTSPAEQGLANIPLATGHEAKGVVLPDFDPDGHLRGRFEAGTVRRIDDGHIGFQDLKITTYTPEKNIDLQIDLRTSVLDLKTRILSSHEHTVVRRSDFNIVGDSAEFDTATRTGRLIGNVKMVISDTSELLGKKPE